jgi:hypothetical protein
MEDDAFKPMSIEEYEAELSLERGLSAIPLHADAPISDIVYAMHTPAIPDPHPIRTVFELIREFSPLGLFQQRSRSREADQAPQELVGAEVLDGCGEGRGNWLAIARLERDFSEEMPFRMPSAELAARIEAVLVEALFSGPPALGAQVASVLNAPALNLCIANGKPTLGVVREMVQALRRGLQAEQEASLNFCREQFFETPASILDGSASRALEELSVVRNGLAHGRIAEWPAESHRQLCLRLLGAPQVGDWLRTAVPRVSVSELFLLRAMRRVGGADPRQ